jgi:hypothetical protein
MMRWKLSIPLLEDLTVPQRIVLTVAICILVLLILFALGNREETPAQEYVVTKYEERMIQLEREAIEEAFKKHIIRLYETWVTDYAPVEPPRAVKGAANARAAYFRSMERLDERQKAIPVR